MSQIEDSLFDIYTTIVKENLLPEFNKQKKWKNKISTNINLHSKNGSMLFIGFEVVKVRIAINKV